MHPTQGHDVRLSRTSPGVRGALGLRGGVSRVRERRQPQKRGNAFEPDGAGPGCRRCDSTRVPEPQPQWQSPNSSRSLCHVDGPGQHRDTRQHGQDTRGKGSSVAMREMPSDATGRQHHPPTGWRKRSSQLPGGLQTGSSPWGSPLQGTEPRKHVSAPTCTQTSATAPKTRKKTFPSPGAWDVHTRAGHPAGRPRTARPRPAALGGRCRGDRGPAAGSGSSRRAHGPPHRPQVGAA